MKPVPELTKSDKTFNTRQYDKFCYYNILIINILTRGYLLAFKRRPFTLQKVTFWSVKAYLLQHGTGFYENPDEIR